MCREPREERSWSWKKEMNPVGVDARIIGQRAIPPELTQRTEIQSIRPCPKSPRPDFSRVLMGPSAYSTRGNAIVGRFLKPDFSVRNRPQIPFEALRGLARARPVEEKCELCSLLLTSRHRHLLETANRRVWCACDGCALRFDGVVGGRFKLIPREARPLTGFRLADSIWEGLAIPINLAFFVYSTPKRRIAAFYPSPAGPIESFLALADWDKVVGVNPSLNEMQADVEALLVNRTQGRGDFYLTPIDTCFELVGLIRTHWRGLSGGEGVWEKIEVFFEALKDQGRDIAPV